MSSTPTPGWPAFFARPRPKVSKPAFDEAAIPLLSLPEELNILRLLADYPDLVEGAARQLEPHRITYCLTELASQLHSYYRNHRFISDDVELTQARFWLAAGVKTVLAHGLAILGVAGPESM